MLFDRSFLFPGFYSVCITIKSVKSTTCSLFHMLGYSFIGC